MLPVMLQRAAETRHRARSRERRSRSGWCWQTVILEIEAAAGRAAAGSAAGAAGLTGWTKPGATLTCVTSRAAPPPKLSGSRISALEISTRPPTVPVVSKRPGQGQRGREGRVDHRAVVVAAVLDTDGQIGRQPGGGIDVDRAADGDPAALGHPAREALDRRGPAVQLDAGRRHRSRRSCVAASTIVAFDSATVPDIDVALATLRSSSPCRQDRVRDR